MRFELPFFKRFGYFSKLINLDFDITFLLTIFVQIFFQKINCDKLLTLT